MANLKKILNIPEAATDSRLRDVCGKHGARIFSKIRLADVLPIESSGISDVKFRFALQSHFDFVVAYEDSTPLFAVEFDGPLHANSEQQTRDNTKNDLCARFELPLLRINSNYLKKAYRGMDLLSWFVEVWFASRWFYEAQESGELPDDEIFMPNMMVSLPGYDKQFPLWLSATIRRKIQKLFFSGRIIDMAPSLIIGKSKEGIYKAISYVRITKEKGVMVDTAMRKQNFPVSQADALEELVTYQLYERLTEVLNEGKGEIPIEEIDARLKNFDEKYEMRSACCVASSATEGDALSR